MPEIQKSPDISPPIAIRGVFLDISKALDKVWYKGLVYKFKSYGRSDNLFEFIENHVTDGKIRENRK